MGLREHNASSDAMHLVACTTCNGCGFFPDALSVLGFADTGHPRTAPIFSEREVVSDICQDVIHLPSDAAPETLPHMGVRDDVMELLLFVMHMSK